MKKMLAILSLIVVVVSGCAWTNEGEVDFRRTNITYTDEQKEIDGEIKKVSNGAKDNTEKISITKNHKLLQKLEVKNFSLGENASFEKGDSLSVHLRSAFIKNFSENTLSPWITKAFTKTWGNPKGEIAIVANSFEMKDGKELSFENMQEGRVVFYSKDVHKGQFFNFNNMPIYGPLEYSGAPFAFRIAIFELDINSSQMEALLGTISMAGATAYAPASPVLELLNGLGKTLYNGDQNDTEFRYSMVLDHKSGSRYINHFKLEIGNYVLIRKERKSFCDKVKNYIGYDRQKNHIPWDRLRLNENEAKLYIIDDNNKLVPYTEKTYLIVEINKNLCDVNIELDENNFSSLIGVLQESDKTKAKSWKFTHDAVMKLAIERSQIRNFSRAKEILDDLEKSEKTLSVHEKRTEAKELFKMLARSVDEEGNCLEVDPDKTDSIKYELSDSQVKYILKRLRKLTKVKINDKNWHKLSIKNIALAFSEEEKGSQDEQKVILDMIAPFKL